MMAGKKWPSIILPFRIRRGGLLSLTDCLFGKEMRLSEIAFAGKGLVIPSAYLHGL